MTFDDLINFWLREVSNKKIVRSRSGFALNLFKRVRSKDSFRYLFLFRLAQYFYSKPSILRAYGKHLSRKINRTYAIDIPVSLQVGAGLTIAHLPGIVITGHVVIGENCTLRQNTTIGIKTLGKAHYHLAIGNNVSIGANSCIIADELLIGDNVEIGAMTFVNKDIASGTTYFNRRLS